jgi:hypothetical protein
VGADLGAEPVLQRGDDAAAVRVVLGVGRGHQHHVEGQADLVAPDLNVALLQHVEETDLDPLGEVGQFVDGEDPPVGAGDEPVVDGQFVGQVAALGHPDGVDLADEVGDRRVGRRQLLAEALSAMNPGDRRVVALLGHEIPGRLGDRVVGVVVDLAAGHHRRPLVEQVDQGPDDAGLGLPPFPEEDHVVPGQQGVLELREHRVLVTQEPGHDRLAGGHAGHGVHPHLLLDRPGLPAALPELSDGLGAVRHAVLDLDR